MRYINTARNGPGYPRDLLDYFVAELLAARGAPATASPFYLISPWITDLDLFLTRRGYLSDLFPGQSRVALSDVLLGLLDAGARLRIAVFAPGPDETEWDATVRSTVGLVRRLWSARRERVEARFFSDLHTKILVGQVAALHGSSNQTYRGVYLNKELLTYAVDPTEVAALREEARATFCSPDNRLDELQILGG